MRTRSPRTVALAVVVMALAAGGCGDSDGAGTTAASTRSATAPAPTRQEFRRATARICARIERQVGAYVPLGTDPATRRANRNGIIALVRGQIADFRALGYPAGSRAALESTYRSVTAALDRASADETVDVEKALGGAIEPHLKTLEKYAPACQ